jgi:hypothetical protein
MSRREPIAAVVGALIVAFLAPLVPPVQRTHADPSDVVIAEFMASNSSTLFDEDGAASDWIELWNRSADTVDLAGWQLSDSGATWTFPSVELAGGARLVVFASDKDGLHPLHTNFKLGASNDRIVLRDPSAAVVSQYAPTYPAQTSNISYGLGSNDVVGYLATPTPGEPNSAAASGTSAKPVLSASGGYLAEPIELTATTTTAGATLYYTTDGSTPSAGNGTEYVGPITIAATTTLRMVASRPDFFDSKVASATFLVMDELLAQTGVPAGWPAGPVNDQLFGYGFDPAAVEAHGAAIESSLLAVPTLSILTDQANLTDPATGIYTNARESGSAWERPVSVEYLDGVDGFQLNGGLRIKGGFSRTPLNPKHSFRLYFEPEYEGALTYPLFDSGTIQTFTNLDLRTEQNYGWQFSSDRGTHLRDAWLRESAAATGNPTSRSQWVHLFLNGQYWGVYMLKDRITADHMSRLYGGDEDDYDVIKHADNYAYEVNDGDDDEWQDVPPSAASWTWPTSPTSGCSTPSPATRTLHPAHSSRMSAGTTGTRRAGTASRSGSSWMMASTSSAPPTTTPPSPGSAHSRSWTTTRTGVRTTSTPAGCTRCSSLVPSIGPSSARVRSWRCHPVARSTARPQPPAGWRCASRLTCSSTPTPPAGATSAGSRWAARTGRPRSTGWNSSGCRCGRASCAIS